MLPHEVAQVVANAFEAYIVSGLIFALVFLPRGVVRLDPRMGSAPASLRLLILPGVAALWPVLAWRWVSGVPESIERNPHRDRARAVESTR
jgi:hypothetical protein